MDVEVDRPHTVRLTRTPHHAKDHERFEVVWRLEEHRISLELNANLDVPRLVPVGGIGESLAQGFVAAAIKALDA